MGALRIYLARYRRLVAEGRAVAVQLNVRPGRILGDTGERARLGDELASDLVDALNALLQVPDWWRFSRPSFLALVLQAFDGGASPRLREVLVRMQASVLDQWRRNPHAGGGDFRTFEENADWFGLGTLWAQCEATLNDGRVSALPTLDPTPDRIWPEDDLFRFANTQAGYAQDWTGLLAFLASVPLEDERGPISAARWKPLAKRRAGRASVEAFALAQLGRWPQAFEALVEARHWAGGGWKDFLSPAAFTEAKDEMELQPDPKRPAHAPVPAPREFMKLLALDPEPDPPAPPPPLPLRLVLWGQPVWQKEWKRLEGSATLTPWGPEELHWDAARPEEVRRFEAQGWRAPRWALVKGDRTVFASGEALPTARQLALHLEGAGPSRLQRLEAFIRKHPDQLDARRERFDLLWKRMPSPVLEPTLAQDAFAAWIPIPQRPQGDWMPDPSLWQPLAARLLPEVEAALRRWPSNPKLWRLWLSWRALRSTTASVHTFAIGLPVLGLQGAWRASLPAEVHATMAKELRGTRRFSDMRDWFRPAWDALHLPNEASTAETARKAAILDGLQEALGGLGLQAELQELLRSLRTRGI